MQLLANTTARQYNCRSIQLPVNTNAGQYNCSSIQLLVNTIARQYNCRPIQLPVNTTPRRKCWATRGRKCLREQFGQRKSHSRWTINQKLKWNCRMRNKGIALLEWEESEVDRTDSLGNCKFCKVKSDSPRIINEKLNWNHHFPKSKQLFWPLF